MKRDERAVIAEIEDVSLADLRVWVSEGWVRPALSEAGPMFDDLDLARVRLLSELCGDLALPREALPVVLTLIDRLHETRRDLRCLAEAIGDQPDTVRDAVVAGYRLRRAPVGKP